MMPRVKRSPLRTQARDAVAHRRAVKAARSLHRPLVRRRRSRHRPAGSGTTSPRDCMRGRCSTSMNSPPAKSRAGSLSRIGRLQREDELAVEIAVQAVVVARPVAQQQRRRPLLAAGVAFAAARPRGSAESACRCPAARSSGWRRRPAPDRAPARSALDRLGQRIGEILVLALPVAVALHDDVAAEVRPRRATARPGRGIRPGAIRPGDGEAAGGESSCRYLCRSSGHPAALAELLLSARRLI